MRDQETAQIGRVVTLEHGKGLGGKLLKAGIEKYDQNSIRGGFILKPSAMRPAFMLGKAFAYAQRNSLKMAFLMSG